MNDEKLQEINANLRANLVGVETAWRNRATAIVIQAAEDYRKALIIRNQYSTGVKRDNAETTIAACEAFFKSEWVEALVDMCPLKIMEHIQREVAGDERD